MVLVGVVQGATCGGVVVRAADMAAGGAAPMSFEKQLMTWGGVRPKLERRGITFAGSLTVDSSREFTGGGEPGSDTIRYLLDIRGSFDLDKLAGIPGASASVDFQQQDGPNGSQRLGDIQRYDNIDADGRTQISEAWYQQYLFNQKVRVKVGKVDANTEFALPDRTASFINSSFAYSPTILNMPTYPDPAMSLNVFVYPASWLYLGYGIYDGAMAEGISTGDHSPKTLWQGPGDFFQIGEAGVRWQFGGEKLSGHFALGGYFENASVATFSGARQHGAAGGYLVLEQQFIKTSRAGQDDGRGLFGFFQFGWANEHVSEVAAHVGEGLVWVGLMGKKNPDTAGLGVTTATLSQAPGAGFTEHAETSIEAFYACQLSDWLNVQPDVQYIVHPGGDATRRDALVGTLRLGFTF